MDGRLVKSRVLRHQLAARRHDRHAALALSRRGGPARLHRHGGAPRSPEFDRLVGALGTDNYGYVVARNGGGQRIAILYDRRATRLNAACATSFSVEYANGKQLFDRRPLLAHFTFLAGETAYNDLLVVGVHLASGQQNTKNHDAAMPKIVAQLEEAREEEWCLAAGRARRPDHRRLQASRSDTKNEKFWRRWRESRGWDVLAEDGYPGTKRAGVPLQPTSSIDYILVTRGPGGLSGEEVDGVDAVVHHALAASVDEFRRRASDHLPVTVEVRVGVDGDE